MARIVYNKLIRDAIPAKIRSQGESCEVRTITDPTEFERELRLKLTEEANELANATTRDAFLSEYADLAVVLDALTQHFEFSPADVKDAIERNVQKKGLFKERVFLEWSDDEKN